jgi:hypothetical protein
MNKLENLIKELLFKKFTIIDVALNEDSELVYHLNGFYKSGSIRLQYKGGSIIATSRYDEETILDEDNPFRSLVFLNYQWWQKSKDRFDGWESPDSKWLPYFLNYGLVKEKIEVKKVYE